MPDLTDLTLPPDLPEDVKTSHPDKGPIADPDPDDGEDAADAPHEAVVEEP